MSWIFSVYVLQFLEWKLSWKKYLQTVLFFISSYNSLNDFNLLVFVLWYPPIVILSTYLLSLSHSPQFCFNCQCSQPVIWIFLSFYFNAVDLSSFVDMWRLSESSSRTHTIEKNNNVEGTVKLVILFGVETDPTEYPTISACQMPVKILWELQLFTCLQK